MDDLERLSFASADLFREWLEAHQESSPGIWLQIAKRGAGVPTVSYDEAIDVALCYGWIDGQKAALDGGAWLQRFTPRRPRSRWSKINCSRAERLIAAGAMRPRGLAEVEAARADGRWESAYASSAAATVPEDLQSALDASPPARDFFATLNAANRYAVLYRVQEAKRPDTRARRIEKLVAMLARGETPPPAVVDPVSDPTGSRTRPRTDGQSSGAAPVSSSSWAFLPDG